MTSAPSVLAAVLLVGWFVLATLALLAYRGSLTTSGSKRADDFATDGSDLGWFGRRLTRVHANAYEFVPIAVAALLIAIVTGNQAVTDGLALVLVALRVAQGVVHVVSVSTLAIMVRFTLFFLQVGILGYWVVRLLGGT